MNVDDRVLFLIQKTDKHLTPFEMRISGSFGTILEISSPHFPKYDYAVELDNGIVIGANESELSIWPSMPSE